MHSAGRLSHSLIFKELFRFVKLLFYSDAMENFKRGAKILTDIGSKRERHM
jgi:hypothetical protein